jgi:hypothetical protein
MRNIDFNKDSPYTVLFNFDELIRWQSVKKIKLNIGDIREIYDIHKLNDLKFTTLNEYYSNYKMITDRIIKDPDKKNYAYRIFLFEDLPDNLNYLQMNYLDFPFKFLSFYQLKKLATKLFLKYKKDCSSSELIELISNKVCK